MAKTSGTVTRDRRKYWPIGSLKGVFERRTLTGSGFFYILVLWFRPNFQSNCLYKSKEAKQYKFYIVKGYLEGKTSLPVDARRPKTPLLKLPNKLTGPSPVTIPETTAGRISAPVPFSCQSGECTAIVVTDAEKRARQDHALPFFPLTLFRQRTYYLRAWYRLLLLL